MSETTLATCENDKCDLPVEVLVCRGPMKKGFRRKHGRNFKRQMDRAGVECVMVAAASLPLPTPESDRESKEQG